MKTGTKEFSVEVRVRNENLEEEVENVRDLSM